jgi:hypothetical protein
MAGTVPLGNFERNSGLFVPPAFLLPGMAVISSCGTCVGVQSGGSCALARSAKVVPQSTRCHETAVHSCGHRRLCHDRRMHCHHTAVHALLCMATDHSDPHMNTPTSCFCCRSQSDGTIHVRMHPGMNELTQPAIWPAMTMHCPVTNTVLITDNAMAPHRPHDDDTLCAARPLSQVKMVV